MPGATPVGGPPGFQHARLRSTPWPHRFQASGQVLTGNRVDVVPGINQDVV